MCTCIHFAFWISAILPIRGSENLALNKAASQSSDYHNYFARFAVDGVKGHDMLDGTTCSHTKWEDHPWWEVDLGQPYTTRSVRIYNRQENPQGGCPDCQSTPLWFEMETSDVFGYHMFHQHSTKNAELPLIIDVQCEPPVTGRTLRISIPRYGTLTLCEVEVYGVFSQTSTTSSTLDSTIPRETSTIFTSSRSDSTVPNEMSRANVFSTRSTTESKAQIETSTFSMSLTTESTETSTPNVPSVEATSSGQISSDTMTAPYTGKNITGTVGNTSLCYCKSLPCWESFSKMEKNMFTTRIVDSLTIDTKNVSKERRRYESAQDDRPSSQMMGGLGIAMMVLVFGSIVMSDVFSLLYYIWRKCSTPTKPH